ncbi:TlpA disulfide reductase family protein [Rhodospirillum rubrum]|nr:TlpA disulfide reductase family protein [Rhodospirillum rubrum]
MLEDMMLKPFFRKIARGPGLGIGHAAAAAIAVILTISAGDARAQTVPPSLAPSPSPVATPAFAAPVAADRGLDIHPAAARASLPDLAFSDGAGRPLHLSDYRGKVVVLNLWATWCGPCVKEMPALESLAAQTAGGAIAVLTLSQDRGGEAPVRAFYERAGLTHLPILLDPQMKTGRALGLRGLPTTLVIDALGREAARHEGMLDWDSPAVLALLTALADEAGDSLPL